MLWGRYLYNPDATPDFYHRALKERFGAAGPGLETALAASSRILPLVTTAWCASASNHEFWPEMLTPVSILPPVGKPLYGDSPAPHNVSAISPLDPQLFTTIAQHAKDLVSGAVNARYNTSEVIGWLEGLVATSQRGLAAARAAAGTQNRTAEFRRAEEDILILNGLGMFYAGLFRAALLYSLYEETADGRAAAQSMAAYRGARDAWAQMAARAAKVYRADVSYGSTAFRRGHWMDRLAAIDADVTALEKHFTEAVVNVAQSKKDFKTAARPAVLAKHVAPEVFHPGADLALAITTQSMDSRPWKPEVTLWYRHVNHAERWISLPMKGTGADRTAAIPAAYTASPFPLQYYFEVRTEAGATMHPALNATLSNQPYFVVYRRS